MGKGTTIVQKVDTRRKVYSIPIEDDPVIADGSYFVITPLIGWSDDDRFFNVYKTDGGFQIEGEGYFCSSKKDADKLVRQTRREVKSVRYVYDHWKPSSEPIPDTIKGQTVTPINLRGHEFFVVRTRVENRSDQLYYYEIRYDESNPCIPISIESSVRNEFWGTLISKLPIQVIEIEFRDDTVLHIKPDDLRSFESLITIDSLSVIAS